MLARLPRVAALGDQDEEAVNERPVSNCPRDTSFPVSDREIEIGDECVWEKDRDRQRETERNREA